MRSESPQSAHLISAIAALLPFSLSFRAICSRASGEEDEEPAVCHRNRGSVTLHRDFGWRSASTLRLAELPGTGLQPKYAFPTSNSNLAPSSKPGSASNSNLKIERNHHGRPEKFQVRSRSLHLCSALRRKILQPVLQRSRLRRSRNRLRLRTPRLHYIKSLDLVSESRCCPCGADTPVRCL